MYCSYLACGGAVEHTSRVAHFYPTAATRLAVPKDTEIDAIEGCEWYRFNDGCRNDR